MKKLLKYIWIFFFNILLILYLSELIITLFLPTQINSYLDIDYLRYQKAKELNIEYDTRTYFQAFYEEKKKEPKLSPRYQFTKAYWSPILFGENNPIQNFVQSKIQTKSIIPLRGPINKKTLSCNEGGIRKIANNDMYGFKNPNYIYEKEIEIFLIGDSFTHGECEDENTDIAGWLRNTYNINSSNYGISGAGPLLSLAALKEYGTKFKPKNIIYFYSEANDMQDLKIEKGTFLINYLGSYSQKLFENKIEVNNFFTEYEEIAYIFLNEKMKNEKSKFTIKFEEEITKSKKREKIEIIKDFFELQKLKNIFSSKSFYFKNDNTIDKKLFIRVLTEMQLTAEKMNSNFTIVYLPDWNRFNSKYSLVKFFHKRKIDKIIKSLNIPYIDIVNEFEKNREPIKFYPFGLRGHYTPEGYKLIAESIYKIVAN